MSINAKVFETHEINRMLEKHRAWIFSEDDSARANFSYSDMAWTKLYNAVLRSADFSYANLECADLSRADLRGANLTGANLDRANLKGTVGNMEEIKSLFIEIYPITYTYNYLQIGDERHLIEHWLDNKKIANLLKDKEVQSFWKKWESIIRRIIEMSPAQNRSQP